jgi:hypothetical protein
MENEPRGSLVEVIDWIKQVGTVPYRAILLLTWVVVVVSMFAINEPLASKVAIFAVAWVWIAAAGSFVAPDAVWRSAEWFPRLLVLVGLVSAFLNCLVTLLVAISGGELEGGWVVPWVITWAFVLVSLPLVPASVIVIRLRSRRQLGE